LQGLANTLTVSRVLTDRFDLTKFSQAFNLAKSLYNFVDVGPGKEHADHKLREHLRFYLSDVQCKHVYFAGCHDTGYIPVLEEYSSISTQAARITLVETGNYDRGFTRLGLGRTSMAEVFNAVQPPDLASATSRAGIQNAPVSTEPNTMATSSQPLVTPSLPAHTQPQATVSYANVGRAQSNAPTTLSIAPTRPDDPMKFMSLNASDQRIDQVLPKFNPVANDAFKKLVEKNGQNFCNRFHISGRCSVIHCNHIHGLRLSGNPLLILKHKARANRCGDGTYCYDVDCTSAHHCLYGGMRCHGNCGMTETHNMDLVGRKSGRFPTHTLTQVQVVAKHMFEDGRIERL
jgi:hypothetical protein